MSGDSDKISVSVRFPGGARWTKVPFWMTDGQIIRDTCDKLADSHAKLRRGMVWCRTCGSSQRVNGADCLRSGWPKCCGYTMTIDSPEERANG